MHRRLPHLWWIAFLVFTTLPADSEILVQGRVSDPGGKLPEGVRIFIEPIVERYGRALDRLAGVTEPDPADETSPDGDGFFELAAPEPGLWRVVAEAPGRRTLSFRLRPLVHPILLPPLELEASVPFEVHVVDPEGRPRRAAVALYDRGNRGGWVRHYQLVHTGEDGVAHFVRGESEKVGLEALALDPTAELALLSIDEDVSVTASGKVRLVLKSGESGTIRLVDREGENVEGVLVFQGTGLLPLGRSDADGRLRLTLTAEHPSIWLLAADLSSGAYQMDLEGDDEEDDEDAVLALHPPRTLRGRVVERGSGEGIAGAVVMPSNYRVATTRQGGEFTIDVPALEAPQRLRLRSMAPGYGMAREQHALKDGWPEDVRIVLPRAGSLTGVVVAENGEPIAGALLYATPATLNDTQAARPYVLNASAWRTISGRDGRFVIHTLAPDAGYELVCEKVGFGPARHKIDVVDPTSAGEVRIVLEAGIVAVGLVVDSQGTPLTDAQVRLVPAPLTHDPMPGLRSQERWNEKAPQDFPTAADGTYAIVDLAPGRYDLKARAVGYAAVVVPGLEIETGVREIDLGTVELTPGVTISGRVVDVDGQGVAQALIQRRRADPGNFDPAGDREITAGADGTFTVSELRVGESWILTVSKDGYTSEAVMAVADRGAEPLEIVLKATGRIAGRVVDAEQRGIEGVDISSYPVRHHLQPNVSRRPPRTRTDAAGRFVLQGVPVGMLALNVSKEGYQAQFLRDVEVPASGVAEDIEIVLRPGVTLTGTVFGPDGEPVAHAVVAMQVGDAAQSSMSSMTSDARGRYKFGGLEPGRYVLSVGPARDRQTVSKTIDARSGVYTVDLVMEKGLEISGFVHDASGRPIAGAVLSLTEPDDERGPYGHRIYSSPFDSGVRSRGDGSFVLEHVSAGRFVVVARKEGYAMARSPEVVEVAGGDVAGVVLEMDRGATLRGRVVGLELDELASLSIRASSGPGENHPGQVDYEGRYTVLNLAPGSWHLQASAGGRQVARSFTIEPGTSEIEQDIEFQGGFDLRGIAVYTAPDGGERPLAGAHVSVFRRADAAGGFTSSNTTADSRGRFRFEQLPPGRYQVSVNGDGLHVGEEVDVRSDQEIRLEVATSWVRGFVHDAASGLPIEGVRLSVEPVPQEGSGGETQRIRGTSTGTTTDTGGQFRLRRVPEGLWRLKAGKEGYGPVETTVDLRSGVPVEGLALEMSPTEGITLDVVLETGEIPPYVQAAVFDGAGRRLVVEYVKPSLDGRIRLTTIPAGSWSLMLWNDRAVSGEVPFTSPGHVGQLVLRRAGELHLVVEELEDSTSSAFVELLSPDGKVLRPPLLAMSGGMTRSWPVHRGEARLRQLLPGPRTWTVTAADGRTWSGQANVVAGETAHVRVP